jgi:GT2 family glycosyltransferase|tara:strand:+ start:185 stop:1069 length:885 start_codon:yes stop_codon:yes gene_type:complete
MLISRQNLSVIIVSFKSDHIIHRCISSINKEIEIIVIDNSNNTEFKKNIEEQYENVKCILSSKNIGMGAGNNVGIKNTDKDFALVLNPDVILEKNAIDEIINASKSLDSFGVIAPISDKPQYPNYKFDKNENHKFDQVNPFKVKTVDGYSMLLNLKRLRKLNNFNFFDENIFLYLENDDFCKRLRSNNENIYVVPKSKIHHLGGEAVDPKYAYEIELSRNWHWMWSKFYFNKKHYGYFNATLKTLSNLISAKIKFFYYLTTLNNHKRKIYQMRLLGLLNSMIGKKSFYRPKLDS